MTVIKGITHCPASKKILACTLALASTFTLVAPAVFAYDYSQAKQTYVPASTYSRESTVASASGIEAVSKSQLISVMPSSHEAITDPGANRIHLHVQQLEKRGALDEAAHVLTNGLKMYPRDYILLADLANLNIKRVKKLALHHDYNDAAEIVRQNIYMNPGNAKLSLLLDDVLRESGVNPKDPIERTKIANLLLSERKLNDAEVEYDAALKLQPSAQAYVGLGIDKEREGQRSQAKDDFEKALELDAAYEPAHKQMGLLDSSLGDIVGASAELSRATILDPADKTAGNYLVDIWQRQLNRNFNDVTSHFGLARAFVLTGDLKSAQSEYRQIVTMDPNNPNLPEARLNFKLALAHQEGARLLQSARAEEAQGQLSAAMQKTMQGLRIDPSNVNLSTYKAYLLERTGQYNAARYAYMSALKQDPNNTYASQRLQVLATATTSAAFAAMQGPGVPVANSANLRGYAQPYPGAGEGPANPIAPPPPPQFDHVGTISDLFWQIRGAAADDTIAVQKKEDTLMNMQNMYISLKKQGIDPMKLIAQMGSAPGGANALNAMMAGGAGAGASAAPSAAPPGIPADIAAIVNGSAGHGSSLGAAPPGLPPDIANIISGSTGHGSSPASSNLPPDIAAMINGGGAGSAAAPSAPAAQPAGLPPGAAAMLSTLGLAKPDGSIDMGKISSYLAGAPLPPNLAAIVDSLGLRKPDGTLDLSKIMNMIGGGAGLAAITGSHPAAAATAAPTSSSTGSSAGLPPDIAALLNNSGTPPVPTQTRAKTKTASKAKTKVAVKNTAKKPVKQAKKSVHGQLATKTTVAAPASPAVAGMPAGMNLASFMPVIQMAMQRFIDLENKTNKIAGQLQTSQQSIREIQHYISTGGKLPAPMPQTGEAMNATSAPINSSIQPTSNPNSAELPPELTAPAPPVGLQGPNASLPVTSAPPADIANMINAESHQSGQAPATAPPGLPADIAKMINSESHQSGQMPSMAPPGMPMPSGQSNMTMLSGQSMPQSGPPGMPMPSGESNTAMPPSSMTMPPSSVSSPSMDLAAQLAPPITPGSTRIQPSAPQLDWNSPPVPPQTSLANASTANTPSFNTTSPVAMPPQAIPAGVGTNPAGGLPNGALAASAQVNAQSAAVTNAPAQVAANIPAFTDPGGSSDQSEATTDKKSAHQHKVRVEIEGVRPDILGIRVKFVIINEQNYAIPLPDNMDKLLKRIKVYMPNDVEKVPPHGEVHGSVRVPIP